MSHPDLRNKTIRYMVAREISLIRYQRRRNILNDDQAFWAIVGVNTMARRMQAAIDLGAI